MSKNFRIFLIVLLSILCIFLVVLMTIMLSGNYGIFSGKVVYDEPSVSQVYTGNFKEINIDAGASDVYIKSASGENYEVIVYGKKEYIGCSSEGEKISVSVNSKNKVNLFGLNSKNKIEVYIPDGYNGNIKIANKYGNIDIGYFKNANMDIQSSCGDTYIKGVNNAVVKSNFGDVEIGEGTGLNINQSCGNITILDACNVIAVNNYGGIKIGKITNHLDLISNCGDISIDKLNIEEDSKIKSEFGDVSINDTSEIYVDYSVSFGEAKISNNYNKSDITLKINSSCGDIKIDN